MIQPYILDFLVEFWPVLVGAVGIAGIVFYGYWLMFRCSECGSGWMEFQEGSSKLLCPECGAEQPTGDLF